MTIKKYYKKRQAVPKLTAHHRVMSGPCWRGYPLSTDLIGFTLLTTVVDCPDTRGVQCYCPVNLWCVFWKKTRVLLCISRYFSLLTLLIKKCLRHSNLTKFHCAYQPELTDATIKIFIKKNRNLKFLNISETSITSETIHFLYNWTKAREHCAAVLRLIVDSKII